ncbi:polyprenyl diphosphate synthase [Kutzneria sp. CA-103260]|uniref:polyprenyl diphosphate synthase n=1 Tax=Kutzneria sp. CA-103260 TaxID=2802641 RepID=UPI001BAD99DC|nr:polyprenyl diphosphate synthase [Kutzneria sp. CA-103260]QUQ65535.1 isoprenyl transferase [Kutzneria sp. CA-103260]
MRQQTSLTTRLIIEPDRAFPRHIGIIPDGNRRWARQRGMPTAAGFRAGAERIPPVLDLCAAKGIEYVTLWMMSDRNLLRSAEELTPMVALTEHTVALLSELRRWRLRLIGRLDLLPTATAKALDAATAATADLAGPVVNLAVGYAGRDDIITAVRSLLCSPDLRDHSAEQIAQALTTEHIGDHLSTGGQPDPDLVIRTSGELRLSGFLTWQTAESELYFSHKLWPEFDEREFELALAAYRDRDRRFGI